MRPSSATEHPSSPLARHSRGGQCQRQEGRSYSVSISVNVSLSSAGGSWGRARFPELPELTWGAVSRLCFLRSCRRCLGPWRGSWIRLSYHLSNREVLWPPDLVQGRQSWLERIARPWAWYCRGRENSSVEAFPRSRQQCQTPGAQGRMAVPVPLAALPSVGTAVACDSWHVE